MIRNTVYEELWIRRVVRHRIACD